MSIGPIFVNFLHYHAIQYLVGVSILLTLCFNICWLIKCIVIFLIVSRRYYKSLKLLSVNRGVHLLCQQRNLYNLQTHAVKYALCILCISVEILFILWFSFSHLITSEYKLNHYQTATIVNIEQDYPNCSFRHSLTRTYFFPSFIIIVNINYALVFLLFVSLSILTRYLAARYFTFPFRNILIKYIVWLSVQFLIISLCSTIYTVALSFILFPLLSIINWLVLLRDNRILCRNLKSNLREIKLFGNSKTLYREQLFAFRLYRVFQKILLLSLFFLVMVIILKHMFYFCYIVLDSYCIINIIYGINATIKVKSQPESLSLFKNFATGIDTFIFGLYSLSTVLPLICITIFPLIHDCVQKYKYRNYVYRYNYENLQPLLRRR